MEEVNGWLSCPTVVFHGVLKEGTKELNKFLSGIVAENNLGLKRAFLSVKPRVGKGT